MNNHEQENVSLVSKQGYSLGIYKSGSPQNINFQNIEFYNIEFYNIDYLNINLSWSITSTV
jgi:hypothetical protein